MRTGNWPLSWPRIRLYMLRRPNTFRKYQEAELTLKGTKNQNYQKTDDALSDSINYYICQPTEMTSRFRYYYSYNYYGTNKQTKQYKTTAFLGCHDCVIIHAYVDILRYISIIQLASGPLNHMWWLWLSKSMPEWVSTVLKCHSQSSLKHHAAF